MFKPTRRGTLAATAAVIVGVCTSAVLVTDNITAAIRNEPYSPLELALATFALVVGAGIGVLSETTYGRIFFYDAGGPPPTQIIALLLDAWRRFAGDKEEMSYADRVIWGYADSLPFVGELVAQWLEGRIASQPGYVGPVDTDEKYAPGMTATLAAVNRGGFVTSSSQAGCVTFDDDGDMWTQHAAVSGFADASTLTVIQKVVAEHPGLALVVCGKPGIGRWLAPVTFRGLPHEGHKANGYPGEPYTDFGGAMPADDIADDWAGYGVCHPDAVRRLAAATQVAIYDVEPERNDRLWPALDDLADRLPRNWVFRRPVMHAAPPSA